ncbi:MAG: hypothetical protein ACTTH5_05775 [Wolinella sp.]
MKFDFFETEESFDTSAPLARSMPFEPVATLLCSHQHSGHLSIFERATKSYYLVDYVNMVVKNKTTLSLAAGETPEFGRISIAEEIPRFAYIESNEESAQIFDGISMKSIATLVCNKGRLESVYLSRDGKRCYLGHKDGLVTRWDVQSAKFVSQIAKMQDFVYLIKESPCGDYVVSIGYDRSIYVYDSHRGTYGELVYVASALPRCFSFLGRGYVAFGESRGEIVIVDYIQAQAVSRFRVAHEEIIEMSRLSETTLLFLSKFGKLGIVNFLTGEVLSEDYLSDKRRRYSAFAFDETSKEITLHANDGHIKSYALDGLSERLAELLVQQEFKNAYLLINAHPQLYEDPEAKRLDARFNIALLEAQGLMEEGRVSEANNLVAPYAQIPQKRMMMQKYLTQLHAIPELRGYIRDAYILRAYSLIQLYPLLANTTMARNMDALFGEALLSASELLKNGHKDEAERILFGHKVISTRSKAIKELMHMPNLIDMIYEAIDKEDYGRYFELKSLYLIVSFLPRARAFEAREEEWYFELEEALCLGNLKRAKECAHAIAAFPKGKERVKPWLQKLMKLQGGEARGDSTPPPHQ